MTDALIAAVLARDKRQVADVLATLTEAERRKRAPTYLRFVRSAFATKPLRLRPNGDLEPVFGEISRGQLEAAEVAVVGTATLAELRRAGIGVIRWYDDDLAVKVLLDRRPPWLQELATWALEGEWPQLGLVWALMAAGAIERPPARVYFDALLVSGTKAATLERGELWEVLAHQGDATLRAADEVYGAGYREAALGLERDRLLDLLLDQLGADLNAHRAAWYTNLWRDLEPTAAERTARHAHLTTLLGAAAAPIVSFALDELLRTDQPVPATQLAPALTAKAKKTVKGALKLLDRAPDAETAAIALGHEAAEVQKQALERLEQWGGAQDTILHYLDLLAATQRRARSASSG